MRPRVRIIDLPVLGVLLVLACTAAGVVSEVVVGRGVGREGVDEAGSMAIDAYLLSGRS